MARKWKVAVSAVALAASLPAAGQDGSVLPIPQPTFDGRIAENVLDAQPATPRPVQAPQGVPNVLLFMSDDVGFAMSSMCGQPLRCKGYLLGDEHRSGASMCSACLRSTAWLLALMNSADRIPNHVIALEALCSPGLLRSPV